MHQLVHLLCLGWHFQNASDERAAQRFMDLASDEHYREHPHALRMLVAHEHVDEILLRFTHPTCALRYYGLEARDHDEL